MMKSMLIVTKHSPWSGPTAREALDVALAGGAFDLPIAMLFLEDGVFQLAGSQRPVALEQKDLTANLRALPLFGVDDLYASADCMASRSLPAPELPVTLLAANEVRDLLDRYDIVVNL